MAVEHCAGDCDKDDGLRYDFRNGRDVDYLISLLTLHDKVHFKRFPPSWSKSVPCRNNNRRRDSIPAQFGNPVHWKVVHYVQIEGFSLTILPSDGYTHELRSSRRPLPASHPQRISEWDDLDNNAVDVRGEWYNGICPFTGGITCGIRDNLELPPFEATSKF